MDKRKCTYSQTVIPAITGLEVSGDNTYACMLSHVKALQTAINKGLECVLIVEDDIDLENDFSFMLNFVIELLPDNWDALFLTEGYDQTDVPIHSEYRKIKGTWGAYAYVVKYTVFDYFIRELLKRKQPTDTTYRQLQAHISCFKPNIELVKHLDGYSERMAANARY